MCIKFIIYIYIFIDNNTIIRIITLNPPIEEEKYSLQRNILSLPPRLLVFEWFRNPPFSSTYLLHLFGHREKTFFLSPLPFPYNRLPSDRRVERLFHDGNDPETSTFPSSSFFFFLPSPLPLLFPLWA